MIWLPGQQLPHHGRHHHPTGCGGDQGDVANGQSGGEHKTFGCLLSLSPPFCLRYGQYFRTQSSFSLTCCLGVVLHVEIVLMADPGHGCVQAFGAHQGWTGMHSFRCQRRCFLISEHKAGDTITGENDQRQLLTHDLSLCIVGDCSVLQVRCQINKKIIHFLELGIGARRWWWPLKVF